MGGKKGEGGLVAKRHIANDEDHCRSLHNADEIINTCQFSSMSAPKNL